MCVGIFFHKMLKINNLRCFKGAVLGGRLGLFCFFGVISALSGAFLCACDGEESRAENGASSAPSCLEKVAYAPMQYSKMLRLGKSCGYDLVEIRSVVGRDTLVKRFVLQGRGATASPEASVEASAGGVPSAETVARRLGGATLLQVPLKNVVVLSSAQIGYMLRLGLSDRIAGVGDGKYIVDSALYADANVAADAGAAGVSADSLTQGPGVPRRAVQQVGVGSTLDFEKLISMKPSLVMTFATGGSEDDYDRLEKMGVPAMLTSEWQEDSPLSKAEWIKLYGKLFCGGADGAQGCTAPADTIFEQSRKIYETQTSLVNGMFTDDTGDVLAPKSPRVLAGMSYGGVWYAPGGRSYTAKLIKDAGGRYLWASDTTREMRLSLEDVFALADSADVWINPGMYGTPAEILAAEPRARHIRAFAEKRVFQNDGRRGPGGGNDFYEGAVARPAELVRNLRDLFMEKAENSSGLTSDELKKGISEENAFEWYHNIF